MSGIDIGSPLGFARATLSPVSALLGELTGINKTEWDVLEASFISNLTLKNNPGADPVFFLIFQADVSYQAGMNSTRDSGGRRKAKFRFPYKDGQSTEDLGRAPDAFEINILFHGNSYEDGMQAFLSEANQPSPGVLTHPIRGQLSVALDEYELIHSHESRKAVALRVRFIEHTFTVAETEFTGESDSFLKTALVAALDGVKLINKVITKVESNIFAFNQISSRITAISRALTGYKESYFQNLQRLNRTFNAGSSADLPTLLPVNEGGVSNAAGQVVQQFYPVVKAPNDPFIGFPPQQTDIELLAVATVQAVDQTNALRAQVGTIIDLMAALPITVSASDGNPDIPGDDSGALFFHDDILDLKNTANLMQQVLETGIASSQVQVLSYTTPRLMSVREIAFAAGLPVDQSYQIELLNPSILSSNYIAQGTTLKVPVSR